jgi:hypothetical protein
VNFFTKMIGIKISPTTAAGGGDVVASSWQERNHSKNH